MFWVVLSFRGLAPVDVDVEAEARVRAGNPTYQGQGCCIMATFRFPCRQSAGSRVLREDTTPQGKEQTRTRPGTTRISLLFCVLY